MPLVKKNIIRNIFKSPFLHRIWQLSILNFREHATSLRSPKNLSNLLILLISYLHRSNGSWVMTGFVWKTCNSQTKSRSIEECIKYWIKMFRTQKPFDLERFAMYFLKWVYLSISEQPSNQILLVYFYHL